MEQIGEGQALLAFRGALSAVESVRKTESADMGKYTIKYASLNAVHAECERALELHGLVPCQEPTVIDGLFAVINTFLHEDGSRLVMAPMCLPLPKEAQALGSATTYLRRYSLVAQFGLAVEDDDGHTATVAAQTQPGRRTEAERIIRETISQMDEITRGQFTTDFRAQFGTGLTDLPSGRHGDALTWCREWQRDREQALGEQAQADAQDDAWVQAAREQEPAQ